MVEKLPPPKGQNTPALAPASPAKQAAGLKKEREKGWVLPAGSGAGGVSEERSS